MYKIINENVVLRIASNTFIPINEPTNADSQAYHAWLAEGNTPLSADKPDDMVAE